MRFLISIILLMPLQVLYAQHEEHNGDHDHPDHFHLYEFGGALGPAYAFNEKKLTGSLHLHALRNFGHAKRFGTGLGFEALFDEHRHINLSIPFNYHTGEGLVFTLSPGILFKEENGWDKQFSFHLESLYEFTFEHFHIGPMFELALSRTDIHLMIGIHFALGWGE